MLRLGAGRQLSLISEKIYALLRGDPSEVSAISVDDVMINLEKPDLDPATLVVAQMLLNCICQTVHALHLGDTINRVATLEPTFINRLLTTIRRRHPQVLVAVCFTVYHLVTTAGSRMSLDLNHVLGLAAVTVHWVNSAETISCVYVQAAGSQVEFLPFLLHSFPYTKSTARLFALQFSTSVVSYSKRIFSTLELRKGSKTLVKENDSLVDERINFDLMEEVGNRTDESVTRVGMNTSLSQSKKSDDQANDSFRSIKSVGIIPLPIAECIMYLAPRMFSEFRSVNVTVAVADKDALLWHLSEMWSMDGEMLRCGRISFGDWLARELNADDDDDVDYVELHNYYNWVVYSGHHPIVDQSDSSKKIDQLDSSKTIYQSESSKTIDHLDSSTTLDWTKTRLLPGSSSSKTGLHLKDTDALSEPVETGLDRYCIALIHGILNFDVGRTSGDTNVGKLRRECSRCKSDVKRRRVRGPGTRGLLLSLLQKLTTLPAPRMDPPLRSGVGHSYIWKILEERLKINNSKYSTDCSQSECISSYAEAQSFFDLLPALPSSLLLSLSPDSISTPIPPPCPNIKTVSKSVLQCPDSLDCLRDMILAVNDFARNHVVTNLSLPLALTAHLIDALSLISCEDDDGVKRLIACFPLVVTSALVHFESLSLSRSCVSSGSLAWRLWKTVDTVVRGEAGVDKCKDFVTASDYERRSDTVEIDRWLHGVFKYLQIQRHSERIASSLSSFEQPRENMRDSDIALFQCLSFACVERLLQGLPYESFVERLVQMWTVMPDGVAFSAGHTEDIVHKVFPLVVPDVVLRLKPVACLCGFVLATRRSDGRAMFVKSCRNLSYALRWYNDAVKMYESLPSFIAEGNAVDYKSAAEENGQNVLTVSFLQKAAGLLSDLFEEITIDELKKIDEAVVDETDFNIRVEICRRLGRGRKS